jgi:tetratricopeptide (TPR) repeat protein
MCGAILVLALLSTTTPAASSQTALPRSNPETELALEQYKLGWEAFRSEAWAEAAKAFQRAIDLDKTFKLAYYGLGRSYMGLRRFHDAAKAYEACRSLYAAQASDNFRNIRDADRMRQNDLDQIQIAINGLVSRSRGQESAQGTQNQIRQLRDEAQRIQLKRDAMNNNLSISSQVPAFVSVALGSAYFRQERFPDAERAYKAALDDDPNAGEAHNNLAVLFMLTGRLEESTREMTLAEKSGYRVNPQFKQDLEDKRKGK